MVSDKALSIDMAITYLRLYFNSLLESPSQGRDAIAYDAGPFAGCAGSLHRLASLCTATKSIQNAVTLHPIQLNLDTNL
jgi:hypothetical protein